MKILLIDPNNLDRELLAKQLRDRGYEVIQANGGWVGQRAAKLLNPDLIISENVMPGITGINIVSELRQCGNNTLFFFLSRLDTELDKKIGLAVGANAYLSKPIDLKFVEELLRRFNALVLNP